MGINKRVGGLAAAVLGAGVLMFTNSTGAGAAPACAATSDPGVGCSHGDKVVTPARAESDPSAVGVPGPTFPYTSSGLTFPYMSK